MGDSRQGPPNCDRWNNRYDSERKIQQLHVLRTTRDNPQGKEGVLCGDAVRRLAKRGAERLTDHRHDGRA